MILYETFSGASVCHKTITTKTCMKKLKHSNKTVKTQHEAAWHTLKSIDQAAKMRNKLKFLYCDVWKETQPCRRAQCGPPCWGPRGGAPRWLTCSTHTTLPLLKTPCQIHTNRCLLPALPVPSLYVQLVPLSGRGQRDTGRSRREGPVTVLMWSWTSMFTLFWGSDISVCECCGGSRGWHVRRELPLASSCTGFTPAWPDSKAITLNSGSQGKQTTGLSYFVIYWNFLLFYHHLILIFPLFISSLMNTVKTREDLVEKYRIYNLHLIFRFQCYFWDNTIIFFAVFRLWL